MAQPLTNANIRSCIKKEFKLSAEEFDANHINARALYASQGLAFYPEILDGNIYPCMLIEF